MAFGNSAIEPIWSKCACVRTMSVIASAATPSSASSRTGDIQFGMPNLREKPALPSCMKPVSIRTVRSPRPRQQKENGKSTRAVLIHAADQVDPRLLVRAGIFEHVTVPGLHRSFSPQLSASMRPRLDSPTATIRIAPWKMYCVGRRAEDVQAVEPEGDDQRADEGPEHMELAVAQRRRSKKHRGEGGEQIAVRRAGRAAAQPRGQQDAGQRRADAGDDEAE